jgi:hypothetical protein
MIRRMFRQVGSVAVATFVWQHRGSAVRAVDFARRLPQLVSGRRGGDALTEAKVIVALDGEVPTSTDIRISGISDGAVILRGDLHDDSLDVARHALLRVSDVLDVRTDGHAQPTLDDALAGARP